MKAIILIFIAASFASPLVARPDESSGVVTDFYVWLLSAQTSNESLGNLATSDAAISARLSSLPNPEIGGVGDFLRANRDYFLPKGADDAKLVNISEQFGLFRNGKMDNSRAFVLVFFPEKTGRAEGFNEVLFPIDISTGKIQLSEIRFGGMDGILFDEILDVSFDSAERGIMNQPTQTKPTTTP